MSFQPGQYILCGAHGKNLQSTNDGQVNLHGNKLGWETWTLEEAEQGGQFYICGAHGKNLGAGQDHQLYMHENKLGWETWTIEDAGAGKVFMRSAHGKHLGAGEDHLVYLNESRGACEMWKLERPGTKHASTEKVREWLGKMELGLYFGSFMDNGFDNMRRVKTMDDDDLDFDWIPGIKRGHKKDLRNLIKDMRRRHRQNQKAQQQKQQQQAAGASGVVSIPVARQVSQTAEVSATCPQGHTLQQFQTRHGRYACDECEHRAPFGTTLHGCRICDFDLCPNCVPSSEVACVDAPHVAADGKSPTLDQHSKIEALSRELSALKLHMTELASCDTKSSGRALFRSSPNQNLNFNGTDKFSSYEKLEAVQHSIICRVKNGTKYEDRHPEERALFKLIGAEGAVWVTGNWNICRIAWSGLEHDAKEWTKRFLFQKGPLLASRTVTHAAYIKLINGSIKGAMAKVRSFFLDRFSSLPYTHHSTPGQCSG
jgi:hypothetical protein